MSADYIQEIKAARVRGERLASILEGVASVIEAERHAATGDDKKNLRRVLNRLNDAFEEARNAEL